jgi:hypothetical protein
VVAVSFTPPLFGFRVFIWFHTEEQCTATEEQDCGKGTEHLYDDERKATRSCPTWLERDPPWNGYFTPWKWKHETKLLIRSSFLILSSLPFLSLSFVAGCVEEEREEREKGERISESQLS